MLTLAGLLEGAKGIFSDVVDFAVNSLNLDSEGGSSYCIADLDVYMRFVLKAVLVPVIQLVCMLGLISMWNSAISYKASWLGWALRCLMRLLHHLAPATNAGYWAKLKKFDEGLDQDYTGWRTCLVQEQEKLRCYNLLLELSYSPVAAAVLDVLICRTVGNKSVLRAGVYAECAGIKYVD